MKIPGVSQVQPVQQVPQKQTSHRKRAASEGGESPYAKVYQQLFARLPPAPQTPRYIHAVHVVHSENPPKKPLCSEPSSNSDERGVEQEPVNS